VIALHPEPGFPEISGLAKYADPGGEIQSASRSGNHVLAIFRNIGKYA
jgi:hypothetical protein